MSINTDNRSTAQKLVATLSIETNLSEIELHILNNAKSVLGNLDSQNPDNANQMLTQMIANLSSIQKNHKQVGPQSPQQKELITFSSFCNLYFNSLMTEFLINNQNQFHPENLNLPMHSVLIGFFFNITTVKLPSTKVNQTTKLLEILRTLEDTNPVLFKQLSQHFIVINGKVELKC